MHTVIDKKVLKTAGYIMNFTLVLIVLSIVIEKFKGIHVSNFSMFIDFLFFLLFFVERKLRLDLLKSADFID